MLKLEPPIFSTVELETTVAWLNDSVLMKYSEQRHKWHTIDSQLEYIDSFSNPHRYRKIISSDRYIGTITAVIDIPNSIANVGILIGREFGGLGYGRGAWALFCRELADLKVRKIEAGCMAKNTAMIRIFEKNSMRLEGTRRYHFQTGVGYDHMLLYGMLT